MTDIDIFVRRACAITLDMLFLGILLYVLMMIFGTIGTILIEIVIAIVIGFIYFILLEGPAGKGQTPGKRVFGIKVITEEGKVPNYEKTTTRTVLRLIDGFLNYLPGTIVIFATKKDQRLGDIAAKTIIVKV